MFTIDTEIDVYIDDIIDNLDRFSKKDLKELKEELDDILDKNEKDYSFVVKTLEDEYKFKILNEMYNKYTLEELDILNKK